MRLIDADALIEKIDKEMQKPIIDRVPIVDIIACAPSADAVSREVYDAMAKHAKALENLSIEDSVRIMYDAVEDIHNIRIINEVVRCKDCKWQEECSQFVVLHKFCGVYQEISFCSHGERREPSKVDFRTDKSANIGTEVNDLISRADAIEAVVSWTVEDKPTEEMPTDLVDRINALPSADKDGTTLYATPNAICVRPLTEEIAIEFLQDSGWLPQHDKEIGRPHGEWTRKEDLQTYWYECSVCGEKPPRDQFGYENHSNYCPSCGAEMYVPVQEVELTEEALEMMRGAE